ncbi:hypothetical protein CMI48_00475 [Candidatus Pacearchaeota archaeon]|nr:hypothetical protein [Candidatus Pacearchaeota archaeon]|tara:strand:- start:21 stop:353 length:333 start_codon:yes stop_codon:yes gene_type:complete
MSFRDFMTRERNNGIAGAITYGFYGAMENLAPGETLRRMAKERLDRIFKVDYDFNVPTLSLRRAAEVAGLFTGFIASIPFVFPAVPLRAAEAGWNYVSQRINPSQGAHAA